MADTSTIDLEGCVGALERSGQYRVLRKLAFEEIPLNSELRQGERLAVVLDTETTGLDKQNDEVIELGMIAFTYDTSGKVHRIVGTYSGLREPTVPITPEITAITGITSDLVAGKSIAASEVDEFIAPAALIIAHNAAFDRPFCERLSTAFRHKAWACSATEVPWRDLGFEGVKLAYLLYQSGYFHDGHRALDDSFALLTVLSKLHSSEAQSPFEMLLASARETRFRIRLNARYDLRKELRARGYRWSPEVSRKGFWHKEVSERQLRQEIAALVEQLQVPKQEISIDRMTAFDRFRDSALT